MFKRLKQDAFFGHPIGAKSLKGDKSCHEKDHCKNFKRPNIYISSGVPKDLL